LEVCLIGNQHDRNEHHEPRSDSGETMTLELRAQDWNLLRSEHERLSRDANPALAWDRFLQGCVAIGLERLAEISAWEAFELIDRLEG
jgi:uncharacterized iron-regulated protein